VGKALAAEGFSPEGRPFRAHLTLARVPDQVSPEDRQSLLAAVRAHELPETPPMVFQHVALMRSILGPGGARYRRLAEFPTRPA
jgi:2'-5' RNA ligase